jgi:acetolactate synthase I/III small subunit
VTAADPSSNGRVPGSTGAGASPSVASGASPGADSAGAAAPATAADGSAAATPAHTAHVPPARALPGGGETRRHTLIAIVLDKPGVLNRVSSLMRARSFNIDSLAVSRTDQPDVSRMTITLHGDDVAVEQAAKQLYRLIDVLKVQDVTAESTIGQELALVKIRATESNRGEVLKLVELSKGRVLDVADDSIVAEVTGPESDVETFVGLVRRYGIKELVRTGAVVMSRGSSSIEEAVKR